MFRCRSRPGRRPAVAGCRSPGAGWWNSTSRVPVRWGTAGVAGPERPGRLTTGGPVVAGGVDWRDGHGASPFLVRNTFTPLRPPERTWSRPGHRQSRGRGPARVGLLGASSPRAAAVARSPPDRRVRRRAQARRGRGGGFMPAISRVNHLVKSGREKALAMSRPVGRRQRSQPAVASSTAETTRTPCTCQIINETRCLIGHPPGLGAWSGTTGGSPVGPRHGGRRRPVQSGGAAVVGRWPRPAPQGSRRGRTVPQHGIVPFLPIPALSPRR